MVAKERLGVINLVNGKSRAESAEWRKVDGQSRQSDQKVKGQPGQKAKGKRVRKKPEYAHCFLIIINVYLLLCLLLFGYFILNVYCSSGITVGSLFNLSALLNDAEVYAALLDVIIILMKNPGTVLGLAIMFVMLLMSLLNHAFYSNLLSLVSLIMVIATMLFIVIRDSSYEFWDTDYGSFFGMHLPELDIITFVILIPLLLLLLVNYMKRR